MNGENTMNSEVVGLKGLRAKMREKDAELNKIQESINEVDKKKQEIEVSIKQSMELQNLDELLSLKSKKAELENEIVTLGEILDAMRKTCKISVDAFKTEYDDFSFNHKISLSTKHKMIVEKLEELNAAYEEYSTEWNMYLQDLSQWKELANKIGISAMPYELVIDIKGTLHGQIRRTLPQVLNYENGRK